MRSMQTFIYFTYGTWACVDFGVLLGSWNRCPMESMGLCVCLSPCISLILILSTFDVHMMKSRETYKNNFVSLSVKKRESFACFKVK